jgi:hypothetical protein
MTRDSPDCNQICQSDCSGPRLERLARSSTETHQEAGVAAVVKTIPVEAVSLAYPQCLFLLLHQSPLAFVVTNASRTIQT